MWSYALKIDTVERMEERNIRNGPFRNQKNENMKRKENSLIHSAYTHVTEIEKLQRRNPNSETCPRNTVSQ
jgi:hypothetical protein